MGKEGVGFSRELQREQNVSSCTLHSSNPFNIMKALKISLRREERGNGGEKCNLPETSEPPLRLHSGEESFEGSDGIWMLKWFV